MDDARKPEHVNDMLRRLEERSPRIERAYRVAILVWVVIVTTAALMTVDRQERAGVTMPTINQASAASFVGTPPADSYDGGPQGNVVDLTY